VSSNFNRIVNLWIARNSYALRLHHEKDSFNISMYHAVQSCVIKSYVFSLIHSLIKQNLIKPFSGTFKIVCERPIQTEIALEILLA
jgi:hypothetical protein